jgi:MYXO-CTERM domain-containing protein
MKRSLQSALFLLALLVSSRIAAAATADGGLDASSEAGGEVIADAGVSDASSDASDDGSAAAEEPPEYSPLKCDGSLCDTTTGETTCSMSEGRAAKGGAWPFVMVLALAAAGIRRRAQKPFWRVS